MSAQPLLEQQLALVAALSGDGGAPLPGLRGLLDDGGGAREAGLLAYRRNAQALADKALAAVFPRLRELLGDAQFAALAWTFWRRCPPQGELGGWGRELSGFLAAQPGMDAEPPALARLEWALHEAERAADAALDAGSLELLGNSDPGALWLLPRPGARLLMPERRLVWRRGWRAQWCELTKAEADFWTRLFVERQSLGTALEGCLSAHPDFDFTAWLPRALGEDWLWAVTRAPRSS